MSNTSWSKYEKLVLSELTSIKTEIQTDIKNDIRTMKDTLATFNARLTVVEWKAGMWGALAGFIVAIPTVFGVVKFLRP